MNTPPPRPAILFVDDEPNVLKGFRRMLRGMRNEWDLDFAESGQDAIDWMHRHPVDAVVSDMRMPGVDGSQVIATAARLHPESIRIILSGYADQDSLLKALDPAHRFLAKPCEASTLIDALKGAFAVRHLLPVPELRTLVNGLKSVPVPSERYFALMRQCDDPLSTARSIGEAIESDLGLTLQLLRLANSAYFGSRRVPTTCRQALEMLGVDTVRALIAISEFYIVQGLSPAIVAECRALAEHSLSISAMARKIAVAMDLPRESIDGSATAGLLSHVGTGVLRINRSASFEAAMARVDAGERDLESVEREAFGVTHAELGAYMVRLWGFPDVVVEAIAFHHAPSKSGVKDIGPIAILHLAQAIAAENANIPSLLRNRANTPTLDRDYLESCGINEATALAVLRNGK